MSDTPLGTLNRILTSTIKPNERGIVTVVENDQNAGLKRLRFSQGSDAFVFLFDKFVKKQPLFSGNQGEGTACDGILFFKKQDKGNDGSYFIVCFDLKSSRPPEQDDRDRYKLQLLSAHCFVDYILSVLDNFHKLDPSVWKRHYYIFYLDNNISKTSTSGSISLQKHPKDTSPNNPYKCPVTDGQLVDFNNLFIAG